MNSLCPVCKKRPLIEKQRAACSSACRTAKHRAARKDHQSVKRVVRSHGREPTPAETVAEWARTHGDGLIGAVGELPALTRRADARTTVCHRPRGLPDMREQVLAQAPQGAIGYRLVLPFEDHSLPPLIIPRRASYLLSPFEYPDDRRLRDGCWYRILWTDAKGNRIPSSRLERPPGLCFVLDICGYLRKER